MDQRSSQRIRRASAAQETIHRQAVKRETRDDDYDDDEAWPSRMPSSARRYHSDVRAEIGHAAADVQSLAQSGHSRGYPASKHAVPARRTATQPVLSQAPLTRRQTVDTEDIDTTYSDSERRGRRVHWLFYAGLALVIMLFGWMVVNVVTNWWQVTQDDWHYGRPRTYQVEMVVGHNDSPANPTHFIALNLNRHVEIIEIPGGDATKTKVYVGPVLVGAGQDLAPVTLSFKDVNGDGKPDMIVNVQDSHFVFINDSGQFRSPRANENIQS